MQILDDIDAGTLPPSGRFGASQVRTLGYQGLMLYSAETSKSTKYDVFQFHDLAALADLGYLSVSTTRGGGLDVIVLPAARLYQRESRRPEWQRVLLRAKAVAIPAKSVLTIAATVLITLFVSDVVWPRIVSMFGP